MQDSAAIARTWRLEQRRAIFACVVVTRGLGPRNDSEIALIDSNGAIAGSLFGGALDPSLNSIATDVLNNDDATNRVRPQ